MDIGQSSRTGELSKGSQKLLIATSTIAGTILIVFIVYVIVRMRDGAALVDVLKLRRSNAHYPIDVKEHPIRWNQSYSVRSSHHPSITVAARRQKEVQHLPLPATQRTEHRRSYFKNYWQEKAMPGTPTNIISSWFNKSDGSSMKKPETVYSGGTKRGSVDRSSNRYSATTYQTARSRMSKASKAPSISTRDISGDAELLTPTSNRNIPKDIRWSWTNSEAPSTPRMNFGSKRFSAGSKKYRASSSWGEVQMEPIDENGATPAVPGLAVPPPAYTASSQQPKTPGLRTFFS